MGAQAFGGIRAGGRIGMTAMLGNPASTNPDAQQSARPQPGSPYSTSSPVRGGITTTTPTALLILVGLEVLALVALRRGFRFHHGG